MNKLKTALYWYTMRFIATGFGGTQANNWLTLNEREPKYYEIENAALLTLRFFETDATSKSGIAP